MLKNSKGFSLIELAIGLAVVTVLILAISVSAGIRDNARVQSAANSIQTLRSAAENYLALGKLNYSDMTVATLKTAQLLPANFNSTKTNPWGGDFNVGPNTNSSRFDVTVSGLVKADADKLTSYFNNSASNVAFDEGQKTWTVTF